ncbi:MAG: aromatic-ring-hydroxylating dioxygenase subunit beta [Defluviicoccus sp.]|nr:aromatic-ring-hydroxylating dioxygenase subunit beta [Defluviicoccus sp.]MDE0385160.1 aromatic-ring-hydroxylating dioxygenase subunit beta [Defluviicoccus sp.]
MADGPSLDDLLLHREIEDFLFRECATIDDGRYDDWVDLFCDDGTYWVPSQPDQSSASDTASLIHEGVTLLRARARRLRHDKAFANTPPVRTRHVVGNVAIRERNGDDACRVTASFVMFDYRADDQRVFAGAYDYSLRRVGGEWRIAGKRVDLLNCDAPHGALLAPF